MPTLTKRLIRYMTVPLLVVILGACVGSRAEPFAPELGKSYTTTEEFTLTVNNITLPGLFRPAQEMPTVMTPTYYRRLKSLDFGDTAPLPDLGRVARGSHVQVQQMFVFSDLNGRVRYGKLQLTDSATGEVLTVYTNWDDIRTKLKEV